MSYVRIPEKGYQLIINTDRICYLQDGAKGMAIYMAGHDTPLLLSDEQAGYLRAWLDTQPQGGHPDGHD